MKKLLVLSVLLGLLALPVFADHVSIDFGGDKTFGFIGDFGDAEAEDTDLTWDVIVGIDDYNSFTWSLKGLDDILGGPIALDKALVTTDVGMWLDLPVGFKINWGYDDPDANEFGNVTGYENTQVYDFSPAEYWGLSVLLSYMFAEVELAFNPGVEGVLPIPDYGYLLAGLALKEPIPGLNAEVYMFQGGDPVEVDDFEQMHLGVGAAYATEVAGASLEGGVSVFYDLTDNADPAWEYGVGVAAGYDMFDVTLGVYGYDGETLSGMDFTVDIAPIDLVTIYAGAVMSFLDADDTFQGADLGVNAHIGLTECYIGYLITENDAGDYNAPTTLLDGGAYISFDVNY
jgi:hypothetical protein